MSADQIKTNLAVTAELTQCLVALEHDEAFVRLMTILENRANGLAVWASFVGEEVVLRWSQGRVQELSELLSAWTNRKAWQEMHDKRATKTTEVDGGTY